MNFIGTGVSIYYLLVQNDTLVDLVFIGSIIMFSVFLFFDFRRCNTIQIDYLNKTLLIKPVIIFNWFIPVRNIDFVSVKTFSVAPTHAGVPRYRRYFIVLELKDEERIKLITSNDEDKALDIASTLTAIIRWF